MPARKSARAASRRRAVRVASDPAAPAIVPELVDHDPPNRPAGGIGIELRIRLTDLAPSQAPKKLSE